MSPLDAMTVLAKAPVGPVECELPGSPEHAYLDRLIVKPWGREQRVYDDAKVDVWWLQISAGKRTSLHAHPQKDTWLICIGGAGVLERIDGEQIPLVEGTVVRICQTVIHRSATETGMTLIEVEVPHDKFDLLRISDDSGRDAGYEGQAKSQPAASPLVAHRSGPRRARLRQHSAAAAFRFNLERGDHRRLDRDDLVAAVSLDEQSVADRDLVVLTRDALAAINPHQLHLTVRSNHR